jgi:hypothetical protein
MDGARAEPSPRRERTRISSPSGRSATRSRRSKAIVPI